MVPVCPTDNLPGDPTAKRVLMKMFYSERIKLIEKTAIETDPYLYSYIIKGVTEGKSYTYLKNRINYAMRKIHVLRSIYKILLAAK